MCSVPSHIARYTRAPSKDGRTGVSYGYPASAIPGLHKHNAGPRAGLMRTYTGRPTLVGPGLCIRDQAPTACIVRIMCIYTGNAPNGRPCILIRGFRMEKSIKGTKNAFYCRDGLLPGNGQINPNIEDVARIACL